MCASAIDVNNSRAFLPFSAMCSFLQDDEQNFDWPCFLMKSLLQCIHCLTTSTLFNWYLCLALHGVEQQVEVGLLGVKGLLQITHLINDLLDASNRAELSAVMFISLQINLIRKPVMFEAFRAFILPNYHTIKLHKALFYLFFCLDRIMTIFA